MYTVLEAYRKTLEEADKMGSDLLTLPVFLMKFKSTSLEFIGARAAEIERTQQITTDIRDLVVPTKRALTPDPDVLGLHMASFPNDYFERIRLNVQYNDGLLSRQPLIIRHGEVDNANINPNKRAEKDYPHITQYSNYFSINTGIPSINTVQPSNLILTYVKQPTFGASVNDPVINLNDIVVTFIISRVADDFRMEKGDPTAPGQVQWTETFRKK